MPGALSPARSRRNGVKRGPRLALKHGAGVGQGDTAPVPFEELHTKAKF